MRLLETLREKILRPRRVSRFGDLGTIPLYNQDFEGEETNPRLFQGAASRRSLKSDGLVLCAPEFKPQHPRRPEERASDWASRPAFTSVYGV